MWIHNINPVLASIGKLQIRYYGLVYALGFIITYIFLIKIAKQNRIKNFTTEKAESFIIYMIVGLLLGARILEFVFYHPSIIISNPLEILMIWHGGMSFHGAIIGIAIASMLFCNKYKVNFFELADFVVIPASFFLFLGRIANFINAELVGTTTNVSWCVQFPNHEGCRHPSQLYEAAKNLFNFFLLWFLYSKKSFKKGTIFWLFITLYGLLRFLTNIWRDDSPIILGISMGQILSLIMFILGTIMIIVSNKKGKANKKSKK